MTRSHWLGAIAVLLGLCVLFGVGGIAAVDATDHLRDNDTQHEHPDEVADDGDLGAVQGWLAGRLTEIHVDCAATLSAGERLACDRLDEEYPAYLEQYASVERERTGETNTTDTFQRASETQREFADETRAFDETHEEYRAARAAGDDERARRLARELAARADHIASLGRSLNGAFAALEARTGRDYGPARNGTNETVLAVRRTASEVEALEFTPSTLTAATVAETASFREPAAVRGRLTTPNGTALADRTILVRADGRTVARTRTDADGAYAADYRPVTAPTGPTTLEVRFRPTGPDPYLASTASATTVVESVAPTVAADVEAATVAFGDPLPVTTRVSVLGIDAPGVPVTVSLGGERIAAGETDAAGTATLSGRVPATVPDGQRAVSVRAAEPGTALESTTRTGSVVVAESPTNLTVEGLLDGEALVVSGRLTANGRPVSGLRVGVNVDGAVRKVDTTDADGRYRVRVPRDTGGRGAWSVTADFENPESNLGPTATTRWLTAGDLDATEGTDRSSGPMGRLRQVAARSPFLASLSDAELLAVGFGGLALLGLAAAGGAWWFRRRRGTGEPPDGLAAGLTPAFVDVSEDPADGAAGPDATEEASAAVAPPAALDVARATLGEGDADLAVEIGYGAVRRRLADLGADGDGDARTHWEFYRDLEADLPEDRAAALERLTRAYERAAFAPDGAGRGTAHAALNAAETCLGPAADGRPGDGT